MTHEELVRKRMELIDAGELERLSEVLSEDFVMHFGTDQEVHGVDALVELFESFGGIAFKAKVEDLIVNDDRVAVRYVTTGTHSGEFMGIAPTGKDVSFGAAAIHRIADGKIAETWNVDDLSSLMRQLGAIPGPAQG